MIRLSYYSYIARLKRLIRLLRGIWSFNLAERIKHAVKTVQNVVVEKSNANSYIPLQNEAIQVETENAKLITHGICQKP
jgi:hypothetical protein